MLYAMAMVCWLQMECQVVISVASFQKRAECIAWMTKALDAFHGPFEVRFRSCGERSGA